MVDRFRRRGNRGGRITYRIPRPTLDLEYDGRWIRWWPEDGVGPPEAFRATSGGSNVLGSGGGLARFWQKPQWQRERDHGPIPEGRWGFKLSNLERIGANLDRDEWGNQRVSLQPLRRTNTFGRAGFYIHDSHKGYTAGCIETEPRFFERLREFQRIRPAAELRLRVNYQYPDTYGGTQLVSPGGIDGNPATPW